METVSCAFIPADRLSVSSLMSIISAVANTVTDAVALLPLYVRTVTVACPLDTPVTTPSPSTVRMAVLLLVKLQFPPYPLLKTGAIFVLPPTITVALVGLTLTLLGAYRTVIAQLKSAPYAVRTVMVALPLATPVTVPSAATFAMRVFEDL